MESLIYLILVITGTTVGNLLSDALKPCLLKMYSLLRTKMLKQCASIRSAFVSNEQELRTYISSNRSQVIRNASLLTVVYVLMIIGVFGESWGVPSLAVVAQNTMGSVFLLLVLALLVVPLAKGVAYFIRRAKSLVTR